MKRIITQTIPAVVIAVLLASCNYVMDTKPKASFDENTVWGDATTIDAYAIRLYSRVISSNYTGASAQWESRTPLGISGNQVGDGYDTWALEGGFSPSADAGFNRFADLRAINLLIEKLKTSEVLTEDKKTALNAEAHLLRAMIFFHQTRLMGRFVPIRQLFELADTANFAANLKVKLTANPAESYKIIMEDMKVAVDGLPESSASGRLNKYAALTLQSRMALQAYAYTGEASYLDVAVEAANAVIDSKKYTLASDYGAMFNNTDPYNAEIIYARYALKSDQTIVGISDIQYTMPNIPVNDMKASKEMGGFGTVEEHKFECWSRFFPTQNLIDEYLAIDQATNEAKNWWETSQFTENFEAGAIPTEVGGVETVARGSANYNIPSQADLNSTDPNNISQYWVLKDGKSASITDVMYENRDKRLDATVARDNCTMVGAAMQMCMGGNAGQWAREKEDGGWYNTITNYYWRKGLPTEIDPRFLASIKTDYHWVMARLGECYMNLAEAYLLKNQIDKAVEALNATRVAHGGLPASTATDEATAWADYMRERKCEMAMENGDIYFSYLRWGKYGKASATNSVGQDQGSVIEDLNKGVYKIEINKDRTKALIVQVNILNLSRDRVFTARRYLMPIPQGALDRRSLYGITGEAQNPGW